MAELKDRELNQVDGGYSPPEYDDDYCDASIDSAEDKMLPKPVDPV